MKTRSLLVGIGLISAGALGGAGTAQWNFADEWSEWFVNYNMLPLMSEQTYAIKYLRQDKAGKLQSDLEDSVWRQIAMHAQRQAEGKPLPEIGQRDIAYHCAYNLEHPTSAGPAVVAQRQGWCKAILPR